MDFRRELAEATPGLITASCLSLGMLIWLGLASRRWYYKEGATSLEHRSRYIRLPLLLAGMAVSLTLLARSPGNTLVYLGTGAVWGVTYPLRLMVSYYLVRKKFDLSLLRYKLSWQLALYLTPIHALAWPVSIPAMFAAANELGITHSPRESDENA